VPHEASAIHGAVVRSWGGATGLAIPPGVLATADEVIE
jgi:hypothetical protein